MPARSAVATRRIRPPGSTQVGARIRAAVAWFLLREDSRSKARFSVIDYSRCLTSISIVNHGCSNALQRRPLTREKEHANEERRFEARLRGHGPGQAARD